MPKVDTLRPAHSTPHRPPTYASALRRRTKAPADSFLDFDTPITTIIWINSQNEEAPVQIITYPREDLRVRLSDHKIALAAVGFEQQENAMPYRWYLGESSGTWWRCNWDTPLRVSGRGDTLLLGRKGVTQATDFHLHMPHLLTRDVSPPPELRYTDRSLLRRAADHVSDRFLDFHTQIPTMIWTKEGAEPVQIVLYPREDLRVRLCDHAEALAAVGFTQDDVKYPQRHLREDGVGVWRPFAWDTPLKISAAGDALLIGAPDVEDHKDFQTPSSATDSASLVHPDTDEVKLHDLGMEDLQKGEAYAHADKVLAWALACSPKRQTVYESVCTCNQGLPEPSSSDAEPSDKDPASHSTYKLFLSSDGNFKLHRKAEAVDGFEDGKNSVATENDEHDIDDEMPGLDDVSESDEEE
ncbi:hypothetical protein DFH06DRAFT_1148484 [Mycena polygramma]|nr:hypothetical protein DFH06DRAFT_1148484 [Mycena polygramma]